MKEKIFLALNINFINFHVQGSIEQHTKYWMKLCYNQILHDWFNFLQVQEKIKSQSDILERFERTLEREEAALRETIASLLQEVRSPALLELDATPDEVKPTLVRLTHEYSCLKMVTSLSYKSFSK